MDFRNSNGMWSGFIEVMTENCCHWKYTSGSDGKRLFAHIVRTNRRIFEIQTAYVQVWSKWWWKNVVAENLLPVWTGKGFLLMTREALDGFSKFKRRVFRFDSSDDLKILNGNLLPVWTGKGFLLMTRELLDGFLKFKRQMIRFDQNDDLEFCRWKYTSGCDGEWL